MLQRFGIQQASQDKQRGINSFSVVYPLYILFPIYTRFIAF